jgi:predicted Zn-dependent protease with MMP-like domain
VTSLKFNRRHYRSPAELGAASVPRYVCCVDNRYTTAPSLADIDEIAREALGTIPADLRGLARDVVIFVEEFPDQETEADMELESPFDILGLYRGVPIGEKSVSAQPHDVDRIFLYRRPLLDYWCDSSETLTHVIRHVLIHEIGHHFGLSDEDMERIEATA